MVIESLHPGIAVWLERAWSLGLLALFACAQVGCGRAILRLAWLAPLRVGGGLERLLELAVGLYASTCLLTLLAALGPLAGGPLAVYAVAVASAAALGFARAAPPARAPDRPRPLRALPLLALLVWLAPFAVQLLLPNSDWDGAAYHLPLAEDLLDDGIWSVDPLVLQSATPAAAHCVFALFLGLGAEAAIQPFSFLLSSAGVLAVVLWTARLWSPLAAGLAGLACLSTNLLWEVAITPRIDSLLAFWVACGSLAFCEWVRDRRRTPWLALSAAMFGVALGTKYSSAAPAGLMAAGALAFAVRDARARRLAPTLAALLLALPPSVAWYARNAALFGDPAYPLLRGTAYQDAEGRLRPLAPEIRRRVQHPPREVIARALADSRFSHVVDASPEPARGVRSVLHPIDVLVHPGRYTDRPYHWASPALLLFFALPLVTRSAHALALYGLVGAPSVALALLTPYLRHLTFAVPLLAVGAGVVLAAGIGRLRADRRSYASAAIVGLFLLQLLVNDVAEWQKLLDRRPDLFLTGAESRRAWLERVGYNDVRSSPRLARLVDEAIAAGSISESDTILLVGEAKGRLLRCGYVPDISPSGRRWAVELIRGELDYAAIAASLRRRGIGLLAVDSYHLNYNLRNEKPSPITQGIGADPERAQRQRRDEISWVVYHLERFLAAHAEILSDEPGLTLARIRG